MPTFSEDEVLKALTKLKVPDRYGPDGSFNFLKGQLAGLLILDADAPLDLAARAVNRLYSDIETTLELIEELRRKVSASSYGRNTPIARRDKAVSFASRLKSTEDRESQDRIVKLITNEVDLHVQENPSPKTNIRVSSAEIRTLSSKLQKLYLSVDETASNVRHILSRSQSGKVRAYLRKLKADSAQFALESTEDGREITLLLLAIKQELQSSATPQDPLGAKYTGDVSATGTSTRARITGTTLPPFTAADSPPESVTITLDGEDTIWTWPTVDPARIESIEFSTVAITNDGDTGQGELWLKVDGGDTIYVPVAALLGIPADTEATVTRAELVGAISGYHLDWTAVDDGSKLILETVGTGADKTIEIVGMSELEADPEDILGVHDLLGLLPGMPKKGKDVTRPDLIKSVPTGAKLSLREGAIYLESQNETTSSGIKVSAVTPLGFSTDEVRGQVTQVVVSSAIEDWDQTVYPGDLIDGKEIERFSGTVVDLVEEVDNDYSASAGKVLSKGAATWSAFVSALSSWQSLNTHEQARLFRVLDSASESESERSRVAEELAEYESYVKGLINIVKLYEGDTNPVMSLVFAEIEEKKLDRGKYLLETGQIDEFFSATSSDATFAGYVGTSIGSSYADFAPKEDLDEDEGEILGTHGTGSDPEYGLEDEGNDDVPLLLESEGPVEGY